MRSTAVLFALLAAFLVAAVVSADNRDFGTNLINECLMNCIKKSGDTQKCDAICNSIPMESDVYDALVDEDEDFWGDEYETESDAANSGSLIDHAEVWAKYRTEVLRALTKGNIASRPYLQLLTSPIDADWDTDNPTLLQKIADTVPYWDEYYDPSPYRISTQYRSFVNNINAGRVVKNQASKNEADKYERKFQEVNNRIMPAQMACWDKYAQQQPSGMSVEEFEQKRCPELSQLRSEAETYHSMFVFFITDAYGVEHQALLESRSQASSGMAYRESGTTLKAFRKSIANGVRNSLHVHVTGLSQINRSQKFSQTSTGLKRPSSMTGGQFQFLTTNGKGLSTRRDQFKLDITFESYAAIRIVPDAWFRDTVISKYRNGPFINHQSPLFGTSGTMRLRPATLYVVYRPKFEITVNKSDAFNFQDSQTKKSGGFFSKKSESASIRTEMLTADTMKIIMESKSNVPQIIAIDNEFLG